MKRILLLVPAVFSLAAINVSAAEGLENRACNLQGREIALRLSEEELGGLSSAERNRIARIAAEVCQDFMDEGNFQGVTEPGIGSRQNSDGLAARQGSENAEIDLNGEVDTSDEEKSGLFGDIKIIDPADRVRRPGLKRP